MKIEYNGSYHTDNGTSNAKPIKGKDLFELVKEIIGLAQSKCQLGGSYQWKVDTITNFGPEPLLFGKGEKDDRGILHDTGCINAYNPHIQISKKMLKAISQIERHYGLLDKLFFFDRGVNGHDHGFADGCELEEQSMVGFMRCVRSDGTILW